MNDQYTNTLELFSAVILEQAGMHHEAKLLKSIIELRLMKAQYEANLKLMAGRECSDSTLSGIRDNIKNLDRSLSFAVAEFMAIINGYMIDSDTIDDKFQCIRKLFL